MRTGRARRWRTVPRRRDEDDERELGLTYDLQLRQDRLGDIGGICGDARPISMSILLDDDVAVVRMGTTARPGRRFPAPVDCRRGGRERLDMELLGRGAQ